MPDDELARKRAQRDAQVLCPKCRQPVLGYMRAGAEVRHLVGDVAFGLGPVCDG